MLDDMARFWYDNGPYPDDRYAELVDCFGRWGDPLLEAQDEAWKQFYFMWKTGGVNSTQWGDSSPFLDGQLGKRGKMGDHPSSLGTYEVIERCNYVSNVAYYNSAERICRYDEDEWNSGPEIQAAIMKIFAAQAQSSMYFHGSMSFLGYVWDVRVGNAMLYSAYQILTRAFDDNPNYNSPIFRTATNTLPITDIPRIANDVSLFPNNQSLRLQDWQVYLDNVPTASTEEAPGALVTIYCGVVLPFGICEYLMTSVLGPALLEGELLDFLVNQYIPEARLVLENENLPLPLWKGFGFLRKAVGVIMSLVWAVSFQENRVDLPCLTGPIFNTTRLGAFQAPFMEGFLRLFTSVENPINNAYNGNEEYPGAKFCNVDSPHALWHQLSGDSVFDLTITMDRLYKAIKDRKDSRQSSRSDEETGTDGAGWFATIATSFQNLRGSRGEE